MTEIIEPSAYILFGLVTAIGMIAAYIGIQRMRGELDDSRYQSFVQEMRDGYYRVTLDGKRLMSNKAFAEMNGYETGKEFWANVDDLSTEWYVEPGRRAEFFRLLEQHGKVERFQSEVYRHKTREKIWVCESARIVSSPSGHPQYYEGTIREVTDTMRRLELESSYRKFSENVPGVMVQIRWTRDGQFTIPYCSSGFASIFGENPDEDLQQDASFLSKLLHPDDAREFLESVKYSSNSNTQIQKEFRIISPIHGREVWLEINATPEQEENRTCLWHGFIMDISNRKKAEKRINDLAFYDELTNLPNRRLTLERIDQALVISQGRSSFGALMFLDLDDFKTLNDTRGHATGDAFLQEMSQRLNSCVGVSGTVGRFGGDEFVILLDDLAKDEPTAAHRATQLAQSILDAVDQYCLLDDRPFQTSCSIGIALFGEEIATPHDVLRCADAAMYASKERGKNCFTVFDHEMLESIDKKLALMGDLREAINKDQLQLYYQMQVDADEKVTGAEVLLRWKHPELGFVQPDQFIPLAEKTGVILPVTEWVLEQAFCTLETWKNDPEFCNLKLSVNISARQFVEETFVEDIIALVEKHEIDASRLVLEMTEHVLMTDADRVLEVMTALKKIGIGFSLDDFGTGYSSLMHLRDLPFDEVKVDGRFVRDLEENESDRAIIRSILAMASKLELETVAEWVETEGQRDFLKSKRCTTMQGYLYLPALPRNEFTVAVRQRNEQSTAVPKVHELQTHLQEALAS